MMMNIWFLEVIFEASHPPRRKMEGGKQGVFGPPRASQGWPLEGGEFDDGLLKYWYFPFWVARMEHMFCCFLVVFRGMLFANQWGEYSVNPCRFLILLKSASSQSCSKMMMKIWFLEVNVEACVDQFWWKSLSFFNNFAFR